MKYERKALQLLRRLGVNSSYLGFRYTACAVALNIQNPDLIIYLSKGLYVKLCRPLQHFHLLRGTGYPDHCGGDLGQGKPAAVHPDFRNGRIKSRATLPFIECRIPYLIEHPAWKPHL